MPTVLIAEDDAFFRETMQLALEEHDMDVATVRNGQEVLEYLDTHEPDLILLDLLMPVMDGFTVLRKIQEQDINIPVVILSNLSEDVDSEKCFALGAKDYLVKSDMDEADLWPKISPYLPAETQAQ